MKCIRLIVLFNSSIFVSKLTGHKDMRRYVLLALWVEGFLCHFYQYQFLDAVKTLTFFKISWNTFTQENIFPDSWQIQEVLVPDSFCPLMPLTNLACPLLRIFWIRNLKWKLFIRVPLKYLDFGNTYESGKIFYCVNVVLNVIVFDCLYLVKKFLCSRRVV